MRLLTLRNRGARTEAPAHRALLRSRARRQPQRERRQDLDETVGSTLSFKIRSNDFVRGFAFAATSLEAPATETIRARFFGGPGREYPYPRDGRDRRSDGAARDDGRRVAAFCSEIVLPPGGETKIAIAFGQAREPAGGARRRGARRRRERARMSSRRRAPPGPSGSARSRCAPTGRTSTGWSTPGCPTSSTLRGCSAASARTSSAGRRAIATSCRTCCR